MFWYGAMGVRSSQSSTSESPTRQCGRDMSPAAETNLLDADFGEGGPSVVDQINKVEEILKKLQLIKRERNQILKDLKEKVCRFHFVAQDKKLTACRSIPTTSAMF